MKIFCLLFILVLSPVSAASEVIFSCLTQNGKQISIVQIGNQYEYRFGKRNKPELVFRDFVQEAIQRSPKWEGIGRYLWTNLTLKNGDTFYTARVVTDRMTDEHETEYSLEVSTEEKHLATIMCSAKSEPIVNFPEALLF